MKPEPKKIEETVGTCHELCFINRKPGEIFMTPTEEVDDVEYAFCYYDDGDVVIAKNGYYEKCGYYIRERAR